MEAIRAPHMGINDPRAPVFVRMWNTWLIQPNESVDHIMGWTAVVARGTPGGKLASLVLCCHGGPAYLALGAGISDPSSFRPLRGLVDTIYMRACLVGRIVSAATASEPDGACIVNQMHATGDGNAFAAGVARVTGANVVCATELQMTTYTKTNPLPYGQLDSWEGLWLRYGSDGQVKASGRNPSAWNANCGPTPTATWFPRD